MEKEGKEKGGKRKGKKDQLSTVLRPLRITQNTGISRWEFPKRLDHRKLPTFCNSLPEKAGISWDSTRCLTLPSELTYPLLSLLSVTCFGTMLALPISLPGQPTAASCVTPLPTKPPPQPSANSPVLPPLPPFAAWAPAAGPTFPTPLLLACRRDSPCPHCSAIHRSSSTPP